MRKGNKIHAVFNIILSLLAAIAFVFALTFTYSLFDAKNMAETDSLGAGFGVAISLAFMYISTAALLAFGLIGAVWSALARRGAVGKMKTLLTVTVCADSALMAISVILAFVCAFAAAA